MKNNRKIPLAIMFVSVAALCSAYIAQYVFELEPCILCLYQRIPYAVAGLLALFALGIQNERHRTWIVALCGVAFFIGSGIAFYQVGVEQHWWKAATGCGGAMPFELSLEQMNQQLLTKRLKPCDEIDWTFLGISMATYNIFVSLALGIASLVAAKHVNA